MHVSPPSNFFIHVDSYADYIPFISTVTNIVDIFLKCVLKCTSSYNIKNRYFTYLDSKSYFKCIVLLVPILGNILIYNLEKKVEGSDIDQEYNRLYQNVTQQNALETIPYSQNFDYREQREVIKQNIINRNPQQLIMPAGSSEELFKSGRKCTQRLSKSKKNYTNACKFYEAAAERGHVISMFYLARYYDKGKGVAQNTQTAIEWYEKAANYQHLESLLILASKALETKDEKKAIELVQKALIFDKRQDQQPDGPMIGKRLIEIYEKRGIVCFKTMLGLELANLKISRTLQLANN